MKQLHFLAVFFLFISVDSFGQPDSIRGNFIYLFSGNLIESNVVDYRDPILAPAYFSANNVDFNVKSVKYVKFYRGFYANIRNPNFDFGQNGQNVIVLGKLIFLNIIRCSCQQMELGT